MCTVEAVGGFMWHDELRGAGLEKQWCGNRRERLGDVVCVASLAFHEDWKKVTAESEVECRHAKDVEMGETIGLAILARIGWMAGLDQLEGEGYG